MSELVRGVRGDRPGALVGERRPVADEVAVGGQRRRCTRRPYLPGQRRRDPLHVDRPGGEALRGRAVADVVGEALEDPHRGAVHGAGACGDVHRLVREHDPAGGVVQPVARGRVEDDALPGGDPALVVDIVGDRDGRDVVAVVSWPDEVRELFV